MKRLLVLLGALLLRRRQEQAEQVPFRRRLRDAAKLLAVVVAGAGLLGGLVLILGLVPINASSGHWGITSRILDFASDRTIATWSLGIEAPPLDDRALLLKGAGHYETGCRACHGAPGSTNPRIAAAMTPPPPTLWPGIGEMEPRELFYIVKHGIKFTAMPAWPSRHRDDEVWAMVAFLREFPKLDAAGYRALVGPEVPTAAPLGALIGSRSPAVHLQESCGRCHGMDGMGRGLGAFPQLAGQRVDYLEASLRAYASGARHSGIMEPVAAALSAEEIRTIAAHYAALPGGRLPGERDEAAIERGRQIATWGIPAQSLPACADCHGPGHPTDRRFPLLAGQWADYLELQLRLFRDGHRGGSSWAHLMDHVAGKLDEEQMRDVALFYESLER